MFVLRYVIQNRKIMISFRINKELEKKIDQLAKQRNLTRSEVIREAIQEYVVNKESAHHPYDLGKEWFGKEGSGDKDRSTTYKSRLKSKLREKYTH
jgi:Arc/MetJ-type ribon-helix-helix transcriptional regulator